MDVVPGQASDAPLIGPMLDATPDRVGAVDEVAAGKGFDGDPQRHACIDRGVCPQVPNKRNRVDPWPFDRAVYRGRNKVERLIGKAEQFRRFATRYEKLRAMYLGVVHLALGFSRLRRLGNVNRP